MQKDHEREHAERMERERERDRLERMDRERADLMRMIVEMRTLNMPTPFPNHPASRNNIPPPTPKEDEIIEMATQPFDN